jgi:hypothetical protein
MYLYHCDVGFRYHCKFNDVSSDLRLSGLSLRYTNQKEIGTLTPPPITSTEIDTLKSIEVSAKLFTKSGHLSRAMYVAV